MSTLPFRHPLASHPAGAILGYRRDGRPIRVIAGGNGAGDGGGTGTGTGQVTPPAGGDGGTGTGAPAAPQGAPAGQPQGEPQDVASLPAWAQQLITNTRQEAASHRTAKTAAEQRATEAEQQRQAVLDAIAEATGKGGARAANDPETLRTTIAALTTERDTSTAALRTAQVENAAYRAAGQAGADAAALLDSRAFLDSVSGLDPADGEFSTKLQAAIKAATDANPRLRSAPAAPTRGGGDFSGGTGTTSRPTSLHDAIAAKLGG